MTTKTTQQPALPAGITNDLDALLDALPPRVANPIHQMPDKQNLLEVVLDLGRPPGWTPQVQYHLQQVLLVRHLVNGVGDAGRQGVQKGVQVIRDAGGERRLLGCFGGHAWCGRLQAAKFM